MKKLRSKKESDFGCCAHLLHLEAYLKSNILFRDQTLPILTEDMASPSLKSHNILFISLL